MRISDLAAAAGVPVGTIKFYLRQGLLPAGELTSPTQAQYDESHLGRLRLVRALVEVAGLSLTEVLAVVTVLDGPPTSWHDVLGAAHSALPLRGNRSDADAEPDDRDRAARARELVDGWGWQVEDRAPALAALDSALAGATAAGLTVTDRVLDVYADAAHRVADCDVAGVPTTSPQEATRYVVVGTLVLEPVLIALRRLAQIDASARRFGRAPGMTAAPVQQDGGRST